MVLSALEIFLLILFILVLIATIVAYGYFVRNTLKNKIEAEKKARENRWKCQKIKEELRKMQWKEYFWAKPERFFYITLGFIFFIAFSITTSIYYFWFGFILTLLFGAAYGYFLKWAYDRYFEFPKVAKEKLEEFEKAIKEGIEKAVAYSDDDISQIQNDPKPFYYYAEVTKFNYPPLETNPKKKTVISTRKIEAIALNKDFFSVCKEATTFNLLEPKLGPEKKGCAPVKNAGGCKDYFYEDVKSSKWEDGKIIIEMKNSDIITFNAKEKPDAAPLLTALKNRLRTLNRQKHFRILERFSYEEIIKAKEEKQENSQEEQNQEENQETNQVENKNQDSSKSDDNNI